MFIQLDRGRRKRKENEAPWGYSHSHLVVVNDLLPLVAGRGLGDVRVLANVDGNLLRLHARLLGCMVCVCACVCWLVSDGVWTRVTALSVETARLRLS